MNSKLSRRSTLLVAAALLFVGGLTISATIFADSKTQPSSKSVEGSFSATYGRAFNLPVFFASFTASLSTDKENYHPGETVYITGSGFAARETVTMQVVHVDSTAAKGGAFEADHQGHTPWNITADENGNISTSWLVDEDAQGQTLMATANGLISMAHAEVTFRDGTGVDFRQCANKDNPLPLGQCHWINSIVQSSNARYFEGMSNMQRIVLTDITQTPTDGNIHRLTLSHQSTKGGIHAYDFLTSYEQAIKAGADAGVPFLDTATYTPLGDESPSVNLTLSTARACGDEIGPPNTLGATCSTIRNLGVRANVALPDDNYADSQDGSTLQRIQAYEAVYGNRYLRIYADAAITGATMTVLSHSGPDTGDSDVNYILQYTGTATTILVEVAGHLSVTGTNANGVNWGPGQGSSQISGGPYHFNLKLFNANPTGTTGESLGSQDNQIKGADILLPQGSITISKIAIPQAPQDFGFTTTGTGLSAFTLDDDGIAGGDQACTGGNCLDSRTFSGLANGSYTVTETGVAGWDLTDLTCTDPNGGTTFSTATGIASINLGAGEVISCTYTNTKRGHIIVVKDAVPNDAQDFVFTNNFGNGNPASFSLDDDADGTLSNTRDSEVRPGTFAVSEGAVTGWAQTSATCSDGSPISAIVVSAGETVTCTFVNTAQANLTIVKDAVPNDGQDFAFTTTGGLVPSAFSLDDDSDGTLSNTRTYSNIPTGTYTVAETPVSGWDLTSATCSDGSPINNIVLTAGESVTCTFVNTKRGHIIVVKDAVPNDAQDFTFTNNFGNGNPASFPLDDDSDGTLASSRDSEVLPGTFAVSEGAVTGWTQTSATCSDGSPVSAIVVSAGETVTCTFVNTKQANLTIVKDAIPNDGQDFAFTTTGGLVPATFSLDDDADGTLSNTRAYTNIAPGTYTVAETPVSGWDLTSATCSDGSPVNNIQLSAGESVTCTFVNTKRGHIIIVKDAVPNDAQDFTFTNNFGNGNPASFALDDDADGTLSNTRDSEVLPGTFAVSEGAVGGWDLTSATCSDGSPVSAIVVSAGETVTCTFVNTKRGHIIVVKDAVPNDAQDFTFTNNFGNGNPASFPLDDDADGTLSNTRDSEVLPGTFSVSEGAVTGWVPTSATCSDGSPITAIVVSPGETVTCTFVNTKQASLTIVKDAQPNDAQDFAFTTTGGLVPATFSLDDDADGTLSNTRAYTNIAPGGYSVAETPIAGWDLTSATCTDGSPVTNIQLSAGESVTCTFVNTKRGHIIVVKDAVPNDAQDFVFTNNFGNGNPAMFSLDDDADGTLLNTRDSEVLPGTFAVSEGSIMGWDLTSATCSDGSPVSAIVVSAGETVTCTFVNTKRGSITIIKDAIPNDAQDFAFTTVGSGLSNFTLDDDAGAVGEDGTFLNMITFNNLIPGAGYSVTEPAVTGWDLTNLTCSAGGTRSSNTANIVVPAGGNVTCTFENTKRAMVQVSKTFQGAPLTGVQSFTFQVREGADLDHVGSNVGPTATTTAGNDTNVMFNFKYVPGMYQFCELNIMPGVTPTFTLNGMILPYFVPNGNDPLADNSTVCVNFTIGAGATAAFSVENTPPGFAHTIGFWKNWSSCTGGNQASVLDYVLATFPNSPALVQLPLPNPLPPITVGVNVGSYNVNTCLEGFYVLSKQFYPVGNSRNGRRNSAGNEATNMAAQLLAVKLNIQAGAGSPACLTTLIAEADALLISVGYDGFMTGNINSTQAQRLNELGAIFDAYNNNELSASCVPIP